jgi:2-amino-4-hydroxy-6-hydroxymethyldihydropteridine diphosphokinase
VRAYLGIGGNLGNRYANMRRAVRQIGRTLPILSVSSLYETAPVGFADQPAFLNAVVAVSAPDDPHELHRTLQEIEEHLGRKRTFANAPRTIDIDILLHGDAILRHDTLEIPHPRMLQRAFVMVPLAEIAPDTLHPVQQQAIVDLERHLGDTSAEVWIFANEDWVNCDRSDTY